MTDSNLEIRERMQKLSCCLVIPTFNNEKTIREVALKALQTCRDVTIVNDGSTDSTSAILSGIEGVTILSYAQNKGKGYALQLGLREAIKRGFRYAITIDSDGQHFFEDIPLFIDAAEQAPDSLIVGVRNVSTQENMPQKNTFANKFSNFWFKVETGISLPDTQCGFRLYPLEKIADKHYFTKRYDFELEVLVRSVWDGVNVVTQPIQVYYAPEEERVSHFNPLKDFTRISILNTILVIAAFVWFRPRNFFRSLSRERIKQFFNDNFFHSKESNARLATAVGYGLFVGIIPVWGYQMALGFVTASFLKINKWIVLAASNISLPIFLPFILLGSYATGGLILGRKGLPSIDHISIDLLKQDLPQYLLGSIVFAAIVGAIGWLITFLLLKILRKS